MNRILQHSELADLYPKVADGVRLDESDALRLFQTKDINALGALADITPAA